MLLKDYITESHPAQTERLGWFTLNRMYLRMWAHRYRGPHQWTLTPHAALIRSMEANQAADRAISEAADSDHGPGALNGATGIVITTWNRPQYLGHCLESISRSNLQNTVLILVDDASDDPETQRMIAEFDLPSPVIKIRKTHQTRMHVGLDIGWCLAQNLGCQYLSNLDADVMVRTDWLTTLRSLFESLPYDPDSVVLSGFNRSNAPCILEAHDHFLRKSRMGGINYFFTPAFFSTVRFLLFNENWDSHIQYYCGQQHARRFRMLCCKPSVVQHIGREGINSGANSPFDYADDFVAN